MVLAQRRPVIREARRYGLIPACRRGFRFLGGRCIGSVVVPFSRSNAAGHFGQTGHDVRQLHRFGHANHADDARLELHPGKCALLDGLFHLRGQLRQPEQVFRIESLRCSR